MGLFSWARAKARAREDSPLDEAAVQAGIAQVVEQVDPRLRLIGNYKKKLQPAVEVALSYAAELVARLPPAREASAKTWNSDPTIHALFASVAEVRTFFGRSKGLRALFSNPEMNLDEAFALVTLSQREHKRFGTRSEGDTIQKDVMQTSVDFFDREILAPSASEEEVRTSLVGRVFEALVLHTLADLAAKRSRKDSLKRERAALTSRLKILQGKHVDADSPFEPGVIGTGDLEALRDELERNEQELHDVLKQTQTLDDSLMHINAVLSQPEKHFSLASITMRLDRMNIKIDENQSQAGEQLTLMEATIVGRAPRVGLLVSFPRSEMPPDKDPLKEARRYLG